MRGHVFFKGAALASVIFTFMMIAISIMGWLYGDGTQELSTLFQLGGNGIANATLLEILGLSVLISCLRAFFFHNRLFENMMTLWKTIFLMVSVLAAAIGFIIIFGWFPIDFFKAWVMFILSFGGGCAASIAIMIIKTKKESEKYGKLLDEYKSKQSKQ